MEAQRLLQVTRLFAAVAMAAAAVATSSCGGGGSGGTAVAPPPPAPAPSPAPSPGTGEGVLNDPTTYSAQGTASLSAQTAEAKAVTHHTIALPSGSIAYTAHTGHLVARAPGTNAPQASFFYIAYTADGADAATRPVTFFYNGGPGSSTVWLHLGSFGPKRLATGAPSTTTPTPFPFVDNMETLLDTSDLVFVDAVGTGYSQAIAPNINRTFWTVDSDAAVFRDFVMRWLAANNRTASPKYLFGESYGGTRTPIIAHLLESAGVHLDGIVLQSPALNYASNCDGETNIISCAGFVPSYGQTGKHHGRATAAVAGSDANAAQLRNFTATTFDPAVVVWFSQQAPASGSLALQMQQQTGLGSSFWVTNLNVGPGGYRNNLIAQTMLGRYDARMFAPQNSQLASEGDPSSTFIGGQFGAAIGPYLRDQLGYSSVSPYVTSGNAIATWDFSHDGNPVPDVIPDLATALALRPQLRVLSVNGYHDLATPFHQTERDLARLGNAPTVTVRNYDGGHMTYLDDTSRVRQKQDLRVFLQGGTP